MSFEQMYGLLYGTLEPVWFSRMGISGPLVPFPDPPPLLEAEFQALLERLRYKGTHLRQITIGDS